VSERRRYDSEARSAYAAYKQGRQWRTTPARLSLVPDECVSAADELEREETGTRRLLAAVVQRTHEKRRAACSVTRRCNEEGPWLQSDLN
jgi:hypothetical protein